MAEWIKMNTPDKVKATATTARKLARQLSDIAKAEDTPDKATFVTMHKEASDTATKLDAMTLVASNPHIETIIRNMRAGK
ncbi:MAG: hypothetical protein GWN93_14185 [Deltaproteobacteria bacterium]|nr:hypothetical protein [Deltaproteobacteria bacterium]